MTYLIDRVLPGVKLALLRPGFSLWASLILGLAVGANVAAFAILHGYLFRPLPYASSARLLTPREQLTKENLLGPQVSVQLFCTLREIPEFHNAALYVTEGGTVGRQGALHYETFTSVTPSTFPLLAVKPMLGRILSSDSGMPGGSQEVVLSYGYWQRAFNGATGVIGATLTVEGAPMKIVGVMPQGFAFPDRESAFWVPFVITPKQSLDRTINPYMLIRAPSGWTLGQVNALLHSVRDREIQTAEPDVRRNMLRAGYTIDAISYRSVLLARLGGTRPFWGLFGATLAMVVLATANALNLALARQRKRLGELQLRRALGASAGWVGCMLVGELVPVLLGIGTIGSVIAGYCVHHLRAQGGPSFEGPFHVGMDSAAIGYMALVSALIVGILAVGVLMMAFWGQPQSTGLQELGTRSSGGRAFMRAQWVFASAQMCLAAVLMTCGLLFAHDLLRLLSAPLKFQPQNVVVAGVMLPPSVSAQEFWRRSESALDALPGVRSVAVSNMVPFGDQFSGGEFAPDGSHDQNKYAWFVTISPGFFETLGVRAVAGRILGLSDELNDSNGALVSEALARAWFGRADAIGKMIAGNARIVGVVPTMRWQVDPAGGKRGYAVYLRLVADPDHLVHILIRSNAAPSALYPAIQRTLEKMQPDAAIEQVSALPNMISAAYTNRKAITELVVAFGALAFVVATFGMYAVVEYGTRLRLYEFAIREALGATRGVVLRMVLREVALLFLLSGAISLIVAIVVARLLNSELYSIGVLDPVAYLGSLSIIGLSMFLATVFPTWRGTRAAPADIMRR